MKVWRQISVNFINLYSNKYPSNIWRSPKLVLLIPLNCEFIHFLLDHNRSQNAFSSTCLLWRRPWNPINSCTYKMAQNLLTGQRNGETEPPDRTLRQNLMTEPYDRTSRQNLPREPPDRTSCSCQAAVWETGHICCLLNKKVELEPSDKIALQSYNRTYWGGAARNICWTRFVDTRLEVRT